MDEGVQGRTRTVRKLGMDKGRGRFETVVDTEESGDGGERRVVKESVKNIWC